MSPITGKSGPCCTEFAHGFQGNQFRAGLEYRLGAVELRGAGRYSQRLESDAGVGYNLTRNWGVDVAAYGTQTFLEREPHVGMAISLRYDSKPVQNGRRPHDATSRVGACSRVRRRLQRQARLVRLRFSIRRRFRRSRSRARQRLASRRSSTMCSARASIGGTGSRATPSAS